jgi:hypothetical protein
MRYPEVAGAVALRPEAGVTQFVRMLRRIGWVVLLTGLTISAMLTAHTARAIEPYVVSGVAVEAKDADAQAARQAALAAAKILAYQRLLDRLVLPEDLVGAPVLTAAQIEPLIASFEVESETPKAKSYQASYRFRFNPDAVRSFFAGYGLRFTESVGRPLVVLPVFGEGEGATLWDDPNPWRAAWANHWDDDGLVPLVVPLGELEDLALVDAAQALAGDERALADLAARHGAGGVLVLQAAIGAEEKTKLWRISVKSQGYGPSAIGNVGFGLSAEPQEAEQQFWQRAAQTAAALVQREWKRLNAVSYGTESSLRAAVLIAALQDWLLARQVLDASPFVIAVRVLSLSQSKVDIVIEHRGTVEQLQRGLAQSDLFLQLGVDGWELRIGAGATRLDPKPLGTQ